MYPPRHRDRPKIQAGGWVGYHALSTDGPLSPRPYARHPPVFNHFHADAACFLNLLVQETLTGFL